MTTLGNLNVKSSGYFDSLNTNLATYSELQNATNDDKCKDIYVGNIRLTGNLISSGTLNLLGTTINIGVTGTNTITLGGTGTVITFNGSALPTGTQALKTTVAITGSQSFVVPSNVSRIVMEVWGPGGGGAGGNSVDASGGRRGGGGGGSGGYVRAIANVTPSESLTIVVGVGGAGSTPGNSGVDGSADTTVAGSFGIITARLGTRGGATGIRGVGGTFSITGTYVFAFGSVGSFGRNGARVQYDILITPEFFFTLEGGKGGSATMGARNSYLSSTAPGKGGNGGDVTGNFNIGADGGQGGNGLVLITYYT